MSNDFTLGVCGAVEPNITFLENAGKEVMRIDKNGVTINSEIPLDEAAQHVINALDAHIQHIVRSEREACAKVCESRMTPGTGSVAILNGAAAAIRARGNT
jgi:hypothetical protein